MSETGSIETGKRRGWLVATFAATALVALVPVTQAAGSQDRRSPDARDAALSAQAVPTRDLRSPDARDAASGRRVAQGERQDLRSPDARDATRPPVQSPVAPGDSSGDFEWGYLALSGFAVLLLVGMASTARRRHRRVERSLASADG